MVINKKSVDDILDEFDDIDSDEKDKTEDEFDIGDDENLDFESEDLDFEDFGSHNPPIEKHNDLLRKLTDFDPYLQKQVMEWLGMYWDAVEKKYMKDPQVEPIMNIRGARWCVNFLRTYARDNNIITNIDQDVYNNIMLDVVETAYYNIGTRADDFGITTDGDIMAVCNQLIHTTDLVLIGAGGSKTYTDFLSTTTSRNESVNVSEQNRSMQPPKQPPSSGFMGGMKKFFGV